VLGVCALVAAMALGVAIARHGNAAGSPAPPQPTQPQTEQPAPVRTDIPKPPVLTAAPPATMTAPPVVTVVATQMAKPHAEVTSVARPKATGSSKVTNSTKTVDDGF
jgi:hypothetical protein